MDFKELYKENLNENDFTTICAKVEQSAQDKVRTEYTKKIKELEKQISKQKSKEELELENKYKQLELKEKQLNLKNKLMDNKMPTELADILDICNVESEHMQEYVQKVSDIINKTNINNSYVPSKHKTNEGITKEQFNNMSYAERAKLYETNATLYKKLAE